MRRPSRIQSNRISKTPSRSGPMNVFGRRTTTSSPRRPRPPGDPLRLDLRLAVVADADERRVLAQRVVLGDPVDGRRGDQHRAADARLERGGERDSRPVHVRPSGSRRARPGSEAPPPHGRPRRPRPRGGPRRRGRARRPRSSSTEPRAPSSSRGARSRVRTSWPSATSRRARWRPRKPAPPEIAHRIKPRYNVGRNRGATANCVCSVAGRLVVLSALALAGLALAAAANASNPQIAGLQVALRAYGLYNGPIDSIAGPPTVRRDEGVPAAGRPRSGRTGGAVDAARAGPLGLPLFGRTNPAPADVRLGRLGPAVHARAARRARARLRLLRRSDRARAAALPARAAARRGRHRRAEHADGARARPPGGGARRQADPSGADAASARCSSDWSRVYRLDPGLVRALAWMESGFQPGLVSSAGARGVLQVLPITRNYVETMLLRKRVPSSRRGNIQIGVVYLRQLLREFGGSERRALAGLVPGAGLASLARAVPRHAALRRQTCSPCEHAVFR